MKDGFSGSMAGTWSSIQRTVAWASLLGVAALLISCSAYQSSSGDSWTATFFKDPDRVWNAIELVLIEYEYEVTYENRPDGVIRAQSSPAEDGSVVALAIDQVARTNDQVKVYVKPSFKGDARSGNSDVLKAAADEFVTALENKLTG